MRADDVDRTYTRVDMRLVLLSWVVRRDGESIDLADWHALFRRDDARTAGMATICTRLADTKNVHPTILNLSNCGLSAEDVAQCASTVAVIGQRPCGPNVTVLPVGWTKVGVGYRRPDGEYVRTPPQTMEPGVYHPQPPAHTLLYKASTQAFRCIVCTKELAAHTSLGRLHTLNLSHNPSLGDMVAPPGWVRRERLAQELFCKPIEYRWTCASGDGVYLGESPPGSVPAGAKTLGDALVNHQTLTALDVSVTGLRDRGSAHIVRGLRSNVSSNPVDNSIRPDPTHSLLPTRP